MGLAANAHLAAGLGETPFLEFPYDPPEWSLERRDFIMASPLSAKDGWIELSEAPGMCYEIDEAALERTRIG
jgi:L-alanine-DL-glutamate epimerase-like enolase superfamily enzyme